MNSLKSVLFFCIESALAGPALQTTPGGVETRFYHHWKGLLKLHAKSSSKFLLLHPSPLVRARTKTKIYGNPAAGGQLYREDYLESVHGFITIGKICSSSMRKSIQISPFASISSLDDDRNMRNHCCDS